MQTDQKLELMFVHVVGALQVAKPHRYAPIVATARVVKAVGIGDIIHDEGGGLAVPDSIVPPEEHIGLGDIFHLNFDHGSPAGTPKIFVGDINEVGVLD